VYSRSSSRRSVVPPPDYSGVLFNENDKSADQKEQQTGGLPVSTEETTALQPVESVGTQPQSTTARHSVEPDETITLPLPAPEIGGLDDCMPRYPLPRRPFSKYYGQSSRKFSIVDTSQSAEKPEEAAGKNPLAGLLANAGFDDLLLAVLILMMLESGSADPVTVLLLGVLLI